MRDGIPQQSIGNLRSEKQQRTADHRNKSQPKRILRHTLTTTTPPKQTNRRPSGMEKQRRRRRTHTEPNSTHMDPTHPNPASLRRKHPTMENKPTKLRRTTLRRNHAPILHEPDSMPIRSTKSRQNAKQLQHGPQRIQNGARRYWRVKPCGL